MKRLNMFEMKALQDTLQSQMNGLYRIVRAETTNEALIKQLLDAGLANVMKKFAVIQGTEKGVSLILAILDKMIRFPQFLDDLAREFAIVIRDCFNSNSLKQAAWNVGLRIELLGSDSARRFFKGARTELALLTYLEVDVAH